MEFKEIAGRPDAYHKPCELYDPCIFGNADVKKAIACLLLGGARNFRICYTLFAKMLLP